MPSMVVRTSAGDADSFLNQLTTLLLLHVLPGDRVPSLARFMHEHKSAETRPLEK